MTRPAMPGGLDNTFSGAVKESQTAIGMESGAAAGTGKYGSKSYVVVTPPTPITSMSTFPRNPAHPDPALSTTAPYERRPPMVGNAPSTCVLVHGVACTQEFDI